MYCRQRNPFQSLAMPPKQSKRENTHIDGAARSISNTKERKNPSSGHRTRTMHVLFPTASSLGFDHELLTLLQQFRHLLQVADEAASETDKEQLLRVGRQA